MKRLAATIALFCSLAAGPLAAQNSPVVVELFTSQGCSSCPPADALMHRLARRDDVIGLSLHVDYWDYIGWKDEFADPAFTLRQKAYASAGGRRMIYTPQMIVGGTDDLVGAKGMELAELIMTHKQAGSRVRLEARREGNVVVIRMAPVSGPVEGPLDVHLVGYTPLRKSRITRGENAGRDLSYANVVGDWRTVGQWDGRGDLEMQAELAGGQPAVVLVQEQGPGKILAAARAK